MLSHLARLAAILALSCGTLGAAEIEVPKQVQPHQLVEYVVTPAGKDCVHDVWYEGFSVAVRVDTGNKSSACFTGPPGRYLISTVTLTESGTLEKANATVIIGEPVPPKPPEPTPTPTPPTPTPVPPEPVIGPASIFFIYQSEDAHKYTEGERQILNSTKLRQYIWKNCTYSTINGKSIPDTRLFDLDSEQLIYDSPIWKKAREDAKPEKLPCLVIFDKDTGKIRYSGTVGKNEDECLEIIVKHVAGKEALEKWQRAKEATKGERE